MAKKLKDMVTEQKDMVDLVMGSAQQIWQAGLGAFAKAQHEGSELFDKLVQEGAQLHQLTQHLACDRSMGVAGKVNRLAENVGKQASDSWDKIEKIFDDRVARSLRAIGAPSRDELDALRRELDTLKAAMAQSGAKRPARRAAAATPAVKAAKAPAKRIATKAAARHP
jgi:poly(hydroxyalkanoate) granule-associated protein